MFGSILSGIRNLFGGGGRDDEEERRRQAASRPRTQATVRQPSTQGGLSMPGQLNETPDRPTVVLPSLRPTSSQLEGLNDEDRATAERFQREGKDATAFIQAARNANTAQKRAERDNSLGYQLRQTPKQVARIVASEALTMPVEMTLRTGEAAHRLATGNEGNYQIHQASRENLDRVRRGIAGMDLRTPQEMDERAGRISSGEGTFGDYAFSALDTAEILPVVGLATRGARMGGRAARPALKEAAGFLRDADIRHLGNNVDLSRLTDSIGDALRPSPSDTRRRTPTRDPDSPITSRPTTTPSEPAIKSTNPARLQTPEQTPPQPAPTPEPGQPLPSEPLPNLTPEQQLASPPQQTLEGPTPEQTRQAEIEAQLAEQTPPPAPEPSAPVAQVMETPDQAQARALAEARPPIGPEAIAQAEAAAIRQAQNQARNIGLDVPEGAVGMLDNSYRLSSGTQPAAAGYVNPETGMGRVSFEQGGAGDVGLSSVDVDDIIMNTHRRRFGDDNVRMANDQGEFGSATEGFRVDGSYNHEEDMIRLARGDTREGTYHHESIHKTVAKFLDDQEITKLYTDAVKAFGGKRELVRKYREMGYDNITWREAAEEEVANQFMTYMKHGVTIAKEGNMAKLHSWAAENGIPQPIVDLFYKVSRQLEQWSGSREAQFSVERLYDRVDSGEFATAPRRTDSYVAPESMGDRVSGAIGRATDTAGDVVALTRDVAGSVADGWRGSGGFSGIARDFRDTRAHNRAVSRAQDATRQGESRRILGTPQSAPDSLPPSAQSDVENFGDIVRRSVVDGTINRGDIQDRLTTAAQQAIEGAGGSWDQFIRKYQGAWERQLPWDEVGFTPAEARFAEQYSSELSTLRERINPALRGEGSQPFYSPRQTEDAEYTSSLVNELQRNRQTGLRNDEIDMSLEPTRQYVERYADAPTALTDDLVSQVENTVRTGSDPTPTGVKVTDDIKTKVKSNIEGYISKVDDRTRAADLGDAESVSRLTREADDMLSDIFSDLAGDIRKLPGDSRQAVENLMATRRVYVQSTLRTNMFLNVANRAYDLVPKAFVNAGEKVGLRAALNRAQSKSGTKIYATDKVSWGLANKHSKGALRRDIQRDFRTTMSQAGTGANNPLSRILSKADAAYRGAGTAFTSLGDFTGNAVRATNMRILQQAQDAGITGKADLEQYLVREMSKPSYQNLLTDISNQYRGYASLSQVKTAASDGDPKAVQFLSRIDNIVRSKLGGRAPDRVANELNDLIMPPLSGFSGAVSRMAVKGGNAMTLGQYGYRRGLKMMASDAPGAQEVGQLMMARSILDGVTSAGLAATGVTLGATGHWTGSYPDSQNEGARWRKDGIKENALAFDVGDKVVYFQPGRILGPLALPLVIPTVVGSAIANGDDITDAVGQVVDGTLNQFVENFGIDAIPQKIGELHDLAQGNAREKEAAIKSFMNSASFAVANAVTPAAGLMNNIGAATDEYERDASGGMMDYIRRRNPLTRQGLDPRTDTLGNPIENRSRISGGSAAITMGAGTSEETSADPISAEINRLAGAGLETVPARDIKNTNSQEDASLLINTPTYQNASDEEKAEMFKTALLGTKLSGLSQDLEPAHRSAVIEHNLMKNDKRKAWLEDNDNALNYYSGVYRNKEANGTLTVKDRDLDNKDGARYKMVRSEVNKQFGADAELQNLYEKTNLKKWRNLATSNPELYQRLLDYDNARTEAGVSHKSGDSSSNKYYGAAGRGGRGSGTVSLPNIGGGRSGGGGARSYGNYEEGRRLYNPQVALQAPETVSVPKTPSISVRRGVHI